MNRTLATVLCLLASATAGAAGAAPQLTLRIHEVAEGGGTVMVAVLASAEAFAGEQPAIASFMLPASAAIITFTTNALPAGSYAVRVMHDRNGNGELDSNMVGVPLEPWGFSNDASGSFGPPAWEDVRFELRGETVHDIHLNH